MAAPFTTFPIPATFAVSEWGLPVNVKDFGAIGNNVADDTAAIQAAIDYAVANHNQTIYIPPGNYKTTGTLFLDPPNNLRSSNVGAGTTWPPTPNPTPPDWQFSLTLLGSNGLPNGEQDGTTIWPTFDDKVALLVGPGQGMKVANLNIMGPGGQYRGNQNPNGVGVGYSGTGGGSSRTWTENVYVLSFYAGFKTSANGNGTLGDSNTFVKCHTANVYYGFYLAGTQNYINSFYDCNPNNCTKALFSPYSSGSTVVGGNWSSNSTVAQVFHLAGGGTTTLTSTPAGNNWDLTITATITDVDAGLSPSGGVGGVFNSFALLTANFGAIPLTMTALVGSGASRTATFAINAYWTAFHYMATDAKAATTLETDLQACTLLYAAERSTAFHGTGITVQGVHIESDPAVTTLCHSGQGFGTSECNMLDGVFYNADPSMGQYSTQSPTSQLYARFVVQQCWPFVWLDGSGGDVIIQNSQLGVGGKNGVLVASQSSSDTFKVRSTVRFQHLNMTSFVGATGMFVQSGGGRIQYSPGFGIGEFEECLTLSTGQKSGATQGDNWRTQAGWGKSPMWGWKPAPWSRPAIIPDHVTTLAGTLPALTYSGSSFVISYPLLWGGQVYSVIDWDSPASAVTEVLSKHHFYTYGQDLIAANISGLSWSYKGQSVCVYADVRTLELVFPGLGIKLNDGSSDVLYIVNGVFPGLGYFTVTQGAFSGGGQLSGLKTSTFTGTTIKSEPYNLWVVSGGGAPVTKTVDFTVSPLERSLIVNQAATTTATLPSASLYPGRSLTIKTVQAQLVNSATSNVVPQIGGAAGTAILAATAGKWAELQSSGSNWIIVQSN